MLNFQTNPMLADAIPAMSQQDLNLETKIVYKTFDLEQFKPLHGNRQVNFAHVKRLVDSIKDNGYLLNPITVNKNNEVIDGQHRLEAAKQIHTFLWVIVEPEAGLKEAVRAWIDKRYTIVLKSRQIGFSTLAAAFAFWTAYFWPDRFVVMLSKTEREASKLLSKAKYLYKFLPDWMKQRGPELIQNNVLKMVFDNDSLIESLPSANDPARGESVFLVIIDEMAFLPNPEEAWAAIEPIADVGGRVICLSTAKGEGNIFYILKQYCLRSSTSLTSYSHASKITI